MVRVYIIVCVCLYWIGYRHCIFFLGLSFSERQCPDLRNLTNGRVNYPNKMVGSVATYTCNPDFLIVSGDIMITCQNDSTWDGTEAVCAGKCNNSSLCACELPNVTVFGRV